MEGVGLCQFVCLDGTAVNVSASDRVITVAPPQNLVSGSCGWDRSMQ